jgi:UDP-glucose 4-epimerase
LAIHCAALISVPESVEDPLRYYRENVGRSVDFVANLLGNGCRRLVFSSSAAIYQPGDDLAADEDSPVQPRSPYARSKAIVEDVLRDCARAYPLRALSLRYFNPIGADPLMRTGSPRPISGHVMNELLEAGRTGRPFTISGLNWPTRDGSGLRDYIHVWDLARAHVQAARRFDSIVPPGPGGYEAIDVGTGRGVTVIELLSAFRRATGQAIDVVCGPPRAGDVPGVYTRSERCRQLLDWSPTLSVEDAIRHAARWAAARDAGDLGAAASGRGRPTAPAASLR